MDPESLAGELVAQLRARPYTTLAGLVSLGWILGRSVPLRSLFAIAGVGARAAVATAVERTVREGVRGGGR